MPISPKVYVNYPQTSTPIDAPALLGLEYRVGNFVGSSEIGVGVGAAPDFQVTQAGGGSLTVNVGVSTGVLQRGYLPGDANGGTERWDYAGAQLTATAAAADPTNPRIDIVTLAPNPNADLAVPQVFIVKGTATTGATLGNRLGAPAVPAGRIILADLLVGAAATTILTAQIQDRRGYPFAGVNPSVFSVADQVIPESTGGIQSIVTGVVAGTSDNRSAAMLCWIPRRILAARIRWKYRQGATAATSNYQWFILDASGRPIANTAATAFAGAASNGIGPNIPLAAAIELEAGAYWIGFQVATMGASSSVLYQGYQGVQNGVAIPGVAAPNMYAFAAGNVISGAGFNLGNGMNDAYTQTTDLAALSVPACSIGA